MISGKPRKQANRRVLVHGTPFFGRLFTEWMGCDGWSFRYYADEGTMNLASMLLNLWACDVIYQIGGRITTGKFLRAAKYFGKKRIIVHWIGSDVLEAQSALQARKAEPWLVKQALHWAETPWLVHEVEALGVTCEMMALPGAPLSKSPSPLPQEFAVLVYVPGTHVSPNYGSELIKVSTFYGLELILEVARALPHVNFHMVGLTADQIENKPGNLRAHGRVSDMREFYQQTTLLWRPVRHDGLSFMVLEALAHGRHVLWSYDFPGCTRVTSAAEACDQISQLYELHRQGQLKTNCAGPQVIAENYAPQRLKEKILSRLEQVLES